MVRPSWAQGSKVTTTVVHYLYLSTTVASYYDHCRVYPNVIQGLSLATKILIAFLALVSVVCPVGATGFP